MPVAHVLRALVVALLAGGLACNGGADPPGAGTGTGTGLATGSAGTGTGQGSAGADVGTGLAPRTYHLGFTPFPYAVTEEAVTFVYQAIASDADLVAHHFDDGVPWPEALAQAPYPAGFVAELASRRDRSPPGHRVYLAVTPIRLMRDGLAPYRGDSGEQPLPPPWDTYAFDHPDVQAAFLNHCIYMIEYFDPDYFAMGIEVNLLAANAPDLWAAYVALHRSVYEGLKGQYPDLPIFVSFTGMDLVGGYTEADPVGQAAAVEDLEPYTDVFCLSLHTFLSSLAAEPVPDDVFTQIFAAAGDKKVAVCETSFPAQAFDAYGGSLLFDGTPEKQDGFFEQLLRHADEVGALFLVNFVVRDYDALWQSIGSPDDLTKLWRDTGFYDEDGAPRPVRARWVSALARPHAGG